MTELQQSLSKCKTEGNILFLPPISEGPLENYNEVKQALLKAGAKYKRNTFVFPSLAKPYIDKLMDGKTLNIKKEFQFFETHSVLANYLVEKACIPSNGLILEPSAGQGSIISAIYDAFPHYMKGPNEKPGITVDYCEIMEINQNVLLKKISQNERWSSSTSFMGSDFLKFNPNKLYDRIIANPPFNKNQDIEHVRKMYDCLKEGGRLVSITSQSWFFGSQKKQKEFKKWLDEKGAIYEEIQPGSFKESGTNVGGFIIIIDK